MTSVFMTSILIHPDGDRHRRSHERPSSSLDQKSICHNNRGGSEFKSSEDRNLSTPPASPPPCQSAGRGFRTPQRGSDGGSSSFKEAFTEAEEDGGGDDVKEDASDGPDGFGELPDFNLNLDVRHHHHHHHRITMPPSITTIKTTITAAISIKKPTSSPPPPSPPFFSFFSPQAETCARDADGTDEGMAEMNLEVSVGSKDDNATRSWGSPSLTSVVQVHFVRCPDARAEIEAENGGSTLLDPLEIDPLLSTAALDTLAAGLRDEMAASLQLRLNSKQGGQFAFLCSPLSRALQACAHLVNLDLRFFQDTALHIWPELRERIEGIKDSLSEPAQLLERFASSSAKLTGALESALLATDGSESRWWHLPEDEVESDATLQQHAHAFSDKLQALLAAAPPGLSDVYVFGHTGMLEAFLYDEFGVEGSLFTGAQRMTINLNKAGFDATKTLERVQFSDDDAVRLSVSLSPRATSHLSVSLSSTGGMRADIGANEDGGAPPLFQSYRVLKHVPYIVTVLYTDSHFVLFLENAPNDAPPRDDADYLSLYVTHEDAAALVEMITGYSHASAKAEDTAMVLGLNLTHDPRDPSKLLVRIVDPVDMEEAACLIQRYFQRQKLARRTYISRQA
jgi:broad specificity phosphatase PhoE